LGGWAKYGHIPVLQALKQEYELWQQVCSMIDSALTDGMNDFPGLFLSFVFSGSRVIVFD
jgi:hypothetical protein